MTIQIIIKFPFPQEFRCPECFENNRGRRTGGVFKSHSDLLKHAKKHHPGHTVEHQCGVCGFTGDGRYPLKAVKAHHAAAHENNNNPPCAPGTGLGARRTGASVAGANTSGRGRLDNFINSRNTNNEAATQGRGRGTVEAQREQPTISASGAAVTRRRAAATLPPPPTAAARRGATNTSSSAPTTRTPTTTPATTPSQTTPPATEELLPRPRRAAPTQAAATTSAAPATVAPTITTSAAGPTSTAERNPDPPARGPNNIYEGPMTRSRRASSVPVDARPTTRRAASSRGTAVPKPGSTSARETPAPKTTPPTNTTRGLVPGSEETAAPPSYAAVTMGATRPSQADGDAAAARRGLWSALRATSLPPGMAGGPHSPPTRESRGPAILLTISEELRAPASGLLGSPTLPVTLTTTTVTTTTSRGPITTSRVQGGGNERSAASPPPSPPAARVLPPPAVVGVAGPSRAAPPQQQQQHNNSSNTNSSTPWQEVNGRVRRRHPSGPASPAEDSEDEGTPPPPPQAPARPRLSPDTARALRRSNNTSRESPTTSRRSSGRFAGSRFLFNDNCLSNDSINNNNSSLIENNNRFSILTLDGTLNLDNAISDPPEACSTGERGRRSSSGGNRSNSRGGFFNLRGKGIRGGRGRRRGAPGQAVGGGSLASTERATQPVSSHGSSAVSRRSPTPRQQPLTPADQSRRRQPATRQTTEVLPDERELLIGMAEAVVCIEELEEAAAQAAAFLQGLGAERVRGEGGRSGGGSGGGERRGRGAGPGRGSRDRPDRQQQQNREQQLPQQEGPGRALPDIRDRVAEAARLQKLYRGNRRRAVQEVLQGPSQHCQVSKGRIMEHFVAMYSPAGNLGVRPPPPRYGAPDEGSTGSLLQPFSVMEVDLRLRRMSNTAPGPDGLTYRDLRGADPDCRLLTSLFNACRRLEAIPDIWKSSNTVLIHKKGDRDDLSNWRPLALGDTTPKLFAAVLADRLLKWTIRNKRLSTAQKGFLPCEGCFEHNFVLQEVLNDARRRGRQVVVAWLDLTNAFGSVPHASIHRALEEAGLPLAIRNIVESMYDGCSTRVRTADGLTDPIIMNAGVKQGCPMSPVVFNLAEEPVLRAAASSDAGYTLQGHRHNILAYADDLVLIADAAEGMEELLRRVESAANGIGLHFNPAKCASLHQDCRGTRRVVPTRFKIQDTEIRALAAGESYQHLGVPTGFQVKQTPILTIGELVRDLRAVDESLLTPWQKAETVATFLLPRLGFLLRGAHVEKGPLKEADRLIKKLAKKWLHLPQRASAEIVFLPPSRGGCGLLPLADLGDILTIGHAFRLLTVEDEVVRGLAWSSLEAAVARKIGRNPSAADLATYLSGSLEGEFARDGGDIASLWSRARNAARRSEDKLAVKWKFLETRQELVVTMRGSRERETTVSPDSRDQVIRRLRLAAVEYYQLKLKRKPDQGKVFRVSSLTNVSNHFLRGGNFTRFADWRFIHRARLDVLPLNGARRWGDGDKRCRRCGGGLESLPHVLCHCQPHSAAWQLRHDAVVERVAKACRLPGTMRINKRVEGVDGDLGALRPDIVVRHEPSKSIVIVDVTVPFENTYSAFEEARGRKIEKYKPLADALHGDGYKVAVSAIVVGALGSWDPKNEQVINMLRIGKKYAGLMRRLIVSETIKWSRDIYVEHVSGVRQYKTRDEAPANAPEQPPSALF
ncbi:uncharacterized protein LOC125501691 [Athalia rosae]|uniref:uncharacterized protein LOC125501691 n=1 Tax=Athalia rosae TaxID=37344 RepID=UPI002034919F|nr:uncharacterized protein LOC125501691 [Athalia rosae]